MGFSRQKYWNGLPFPPPGHLPNPGIEPVSLMSPALVGGFFTTSATWETHVQVSQSLNMIFSERPFLTFEWKLLLLLLSRFSHVRLCATP